MNKLQTVLIAVLVFIIAYLYIIDKKRVEVLQKQILSLETKITQMNKDCQKMIAFLKASKTMGNRAFSVQGGSRPLIELKKERPNLFVKSEKNILKEMKDNMGLLDEQVKEIQTVLQGLRGTRKKIFNLAREEKGSIFDTRYLQMMGDARKEALSKVKCILNDEQYKLMIEKGYDQQLGLRIPKRQPRK